jgi:hypothetical protein
LVIRGNSAIAQVWREAINSSCENSSAYEPINNNLTKSEKKMRRSKHFRVRPKVSSDVSIKLACSGIESKIYRDDLTVDQSVKNSKKGFKSTANTDDIDKFVYTNTLSRIDGVHEHLYEDYKLLLDRALELSGYTKDLKHTNETFSFYNEFSMTDIGLSLEILDMIVQEVNVSRQQYCRRGEFILKFVPGVDCYLLIKPTSPDKQIFFSVLVPKHSMIKSYDLPFKLMNNLGDVFISEFVSLNQHSCTHLLYMREKATALLCMWMGLHSVPLSTNLNFIPKHCLGHFNASLLFWLEGKEQTSKEAQQIRYAYMECIKNNRFSHNPLKILRKWDLFTRSRLGIWMRKKVISTFKSMMPSVNYVPTDSNSILEFNRSMDRDCTLKSWITGRTVGKFEIALNLSYFGVLHNKEDSKEMHGYLKIFEKVLAEEIRMRDVDIGNLGINSPVDPKDHEFNLRFSCHLGDIIKNKLAEKNIDIKSTIQRRLISRNAFNLSTMKKTACGDLSREKHDPNLAENERITCLEATVNLLEEGCEPSLLKHTGTFFENVRQEYGGIVSNLFKKLQIGGVREIFVLEFRCRLLIHFVETISRVIGELLDNEMLTKGDRKLARSESHFSEVFSLLGPNKSLNTVINSDDATTWAQRFVMPVFGSFMCRFLPEEFIEPVVGILNLVTNKKLELPSQLLNLFDDNPDIVSVNASMKELKDQYLGLSEHSDLLNVGSRMLKNKSNMMQGILHYTSSILHCAFFVLLGELHKVHVINSVK